jgi:hypothetical protein
VHPYWHGSAAQLEKSRPGWLTSNFVAAVIAAAVVGYLIYLHFSGKQSGF